MRIRFILILCVLTVLFSAVPVFADTTNDIYNNVETPNSGDISASITNPNYTAGTLGSTSMWLNVFNSYVASTDIIHFQLRTGGGTYLNCLSTQSGAKTAFWGLVGEEPTNSYVTINWEGSECDLDGTQTYQIYAINETTGNTQRQMQCGYRSVGAGGNGRCSGIMGTGEIPVTPETYIRIVSPTNGSTTTSPVTFEIEYLINSQTDSGLENLNITLRILNSLLVSGTGNTVLPVFDIVYDEVVSTTTVVSLINNQTYLASATLGTSSLPDICNNPLLSVVYCAFLQATEQIVTSSYSVNFTVGTSPLTSIEDFGNSVFDSVGVDTGIFSGQCAFVATSTCNMTSISTWSGCLVNVGLRLFCPSSESIAYATSTLGSVLNRTVPFGYFYTIFEKIETIGSSTTPAIGDDLVVNDVLFSGAMTMFSWENASSTINSMIPNEVIDVLIFVEWLTFSLFVLWEIKNIHS